MGYAAGIDLGTTYTAAAIARDGHAEMISLGSAGAPIPSVMLLREDEGFSIGDAAVQRSRTEPDRVARQFKRRVGDPAPILLGGSPFAAHVLMGRMLENVVATIAQRQGSEPDEIVVTHPANWGGYKREHLDQAVRTAGLDDVSTMTEPEAAAIYYAHQERVEPGAVVAVYDLGGGTFDAAILRKTSTGFEILGTPEGVEQLGGIDFDQAFYQHVCREAGLDLATLDASDPATSASLARLMDDCVEAKIALSSDTDAIVAVLVPGATTPQIRVTRAEFEGMIRPSLRESVAALERAVERAGVAPQDLTAVLLVGGSSRIPLVGQLVGEALHRPVAVDADPKHAIALGAALGLDETADQSTDDSAGREMPPPTIPTPEPAGFRTSPADPGTDPDLPDSSTSEQTARQGGGETLVTLGLAALSLVALLWFEEAFPAREATLLLVLGLACATLTSTRRMRDVTAAFVGAATGLAVANLVAGLCAGLFDSQLIVAGDFGGRPHELGASMFGVVLAGVALFRWWPSGELRTRPASGRSDWIDRMLLAGLLGLMFVPSFRDVRRDAAYALDDFFTSVAEGYQIGFGAIYVTLVIAALVAAQSRRPLLASGSTIALITIRLAAPWAVLTGTGRQIEGIRILPDIGDREVDLLGPGFYAQLALGLVVVIRFAARARRPTGEGAAQPS